LVVFLLLFEETRFSFFLLCFGLLCGFGEGISAPDVSDLLSRRFFFVVLFAAVADAFYPLALRFISTLKQKKKNFMVTSTAT
jgi:hypothetical protein